MKKRLPVFALFAALFILYSFSSGPPTGRTGAPGEGLCTGCHTGGGPGLDGNVQISGLPGTIIGGNTYTITVTVTNPNGVSQGAGFQMTALDENQLRAGMMSSPSSGSRVHFGGSREYHDHTSRRSFSGGMASWTVQWTAPTPPADLDVTLYAAGNITDSNPGFNSGGDRIVTTNASGTVLGMGAALEVDIISSTNVTCFGGNDGSATANAMGGAGGYTYNWSNGQTGPVASNLTQGTYTVTVTDANNDQATDQVTISQPSTPTEIIIISQNDVSCPGGSDGSIQVQASGNNGGYSYQWSNGRVGPFVDGLSANDYTVTATDSRGCSDALTIEINEPDPITVDVTTEDANCTSPNSGFARLEPAGGTPPYSFDWSNGITESGLVSEQDTLSQGSYTVDVVDDNNCATRVSFNIGRDAGFSVSIVRIDTPLCHGDSSGAIEVSINGGNDPFDIVWSNGETTLEINDLESGMYDVTITDEDGCVDSLSAEVPVRGPNILEVLDSTTVTCLNDSIDVRYTYSGGGWDGPSFDTVSLTLWVDTHFIDLTDPNGCAQTDTIIISYLDTIPPVISCPGDTVTNSCGYSYTLPEIEENCDSTTINVLNGPLPGEIFPTGSTEVTIEAVDQAGNADTCNFMVTVENDLELIATLLDPALCAGDTSAYRLNGSGGSGELSVIVSGDTMMLDGDSLVVGVSGATQVQLLDTSGCFDQVTIGTDLDSLNIDSVSVAQMSSQGADDGRLEIFVSGGTPGYSYEWRNSTGMIVGDSMVIDSLSPGDYSCIITDSNMCTVSSDTFTINLITSVDKPVTETVNVYPNPFRNEVYLESNGSQITLVKVYSNRGELIDQINIYDKYYSYNPEFFATGMVILVIQTEEGIYTRKLIRN